MTTYLAWGIRHGKWVLVLLALALVLGLGRAPFLRQRTTRSTFAPTLDVQQASAIYANNNTLALADDKHPQDIRSVGARPSDAAAIHIAISHYDEEPFYIARLLSSLRSIPTIAKLQPHATIYTKKPDANIQDILETSTADRVISLPNVGREGSTYLHHILATWDNLPPYTLFTQAVIRKSQIEGSGPTAGEIEEWLKLRLSTDFHSDLSDHAVTGFMSLNRNHFVCHCGHCTDIDGHDEFYPMWPQLFARITARVCGEREPSVLSFNGSFLVSKRRIQAHAREIYEYLKRLVEAPSDHWLHQESQPRWFDHAFGKSTAMTPKFGHTLERLWHVLFDCSDLTKMNSCEFPPGSVIGQGSCSCDDKV